jgi:hypothetical protein
MAYVAKSERVWCMIEQNIGKLFTDRINHAYDWESYVNVNDFSELCYRALISEDHEAMCKELPPSFVPTRDSFTFKFGVTKPAIWGYEDNCHPADFPNLDEFNEAYNTRIEVELEKQKEINASFDANFDPERPFPSSWTRYSDEEDYKIEGDRLKQEVAEIVINRDDQRQAVSKDRKNMIANAKGIYDRAKSINQFVKIWEPALSLLDSDIHERLRKKVVRNASAAAQDITDDDIEALNASYVRAKVSQ